MSTEQTPPDETDALKQRLVESLMGVIGAPDDPDVARGADEVLHALDSRLAEESASA